MPGAIGIRYEATIGGNLASVTQTIRGVNGTAIPETVVSSVTHIQQKVDCGVVARHGRVMHM